MLSSAIDYVKALTSTARLILLTVVMELSFIALTLGGDLRLHIPEFFLFYFCAFIAYVAALPFFWGGSDGEKFPLLFCLLCAVAFRLTLLAAAPSLSDDIFRYLWDGRVQAHGINPYLYPPVHGALAPLRDACYEAVNHKDISTIYPPFAQFFFYSSIGWWGIRFLCSRRPSPCLTS